MAVFAPPSPSYPAPKCRYIREEFSLPFRPCLRHAGLTSHLSPRRTGGSLSPNSSPLPPSASFNGSFSYVRNYSGSLVSQEGTLLPPKSHLNYARHVLSPLYHVRGAHRPCRTQRRGGKRLGPRTRCPRSRASRLLVSTAVLRRGPKEVLSQATRSSLAQLPVRVLSFPQALAWPKSSFGFSCVTALVALS